ncbi:MAG: SUMF1/EgtB/PvdO family nonheme iron enzyme [Anaerolineae bacterium]|nr:SUMF1/EgtB/PvdO family nonheme iron enzyme [Anaerolineae bacterium]
MAIVYKAFDTRLEREVAVKVIRMGRLAPDLADKTRQRFDREAKALARLNHPGIVQVIDFGEHEGVPYLVMPYLSGGTLKERIKNGRIPWQKTIELLSPVSHALEYAHRQNIIHRDIKPANILISESGTTMLSDFGVAKVLSESDETYELTGTGMGVGTPEYMAPEQFRGQADSRADIYALGVVMYEMVTGRKPYIAETPAEVIIKQATEPLPRPNRFAPDLPEAIEKILLKSLAKDPDKRYQKMGEFARELDALLLAQEKERKKGVERQAKLDKEKAKQAEKRKEQELLQKEKAEARKKKDDEVRQKQEAKKKAQELRKQQQAEARKKKAEKREQESSSGFLVKLRENNKLLRIAGISLLGLVVISGLVVGIPGLASDTGSETQPVDQHTGTFEVSPAQTAVVAEIVETPTSLPPTETPFTYTPGDVPSPQGLSLEYELPYSFQAHEKRINAVAFSPDNLSFATASHDGTIKIWDTQNGSLLGTLEGHDGVVTDVVFSPDGALLASGSWDETVKVWDVSTGSNIRTSNIPVKITPTRFESVILGFSPDGLLLYAGSELGFVIWDLPKFEVQQHICTSNVGVLCEEQSVFAISSDLNIFANYYFDYTTGHKIGVRNMAENSRENEFVAREYGISSMLFSSDGKRLFVANMEETIEIRNTSDWTVDKTLNNHVGRNLAIQIALSSNNDLLASNSQDGIINIWDTEKGTLLQTLSGHESKVRDISFSADDNLLISGDESGTIYIWDMSQHVEKTPDLVVNDSFGVDMVLVPAGIFTMGSENGDYDEKPVHSIYLEDFYIDQYEVTNALYATCVDAGVCQEPDGARLFRGLYYSLHPVGNVDWDQAKAYCEWRGGRLPSEAQWEKAARGTSEYLYPWGDNIDCNKSNYLGCDIGDTTEVGSYTDGVSIYGVYDMAGNVWEWVDDWYEAYPGNTITDANFGTTYRVLRGGARGSSEYDLRSSNRNWSSPDSNLVNIGFRCARDVVVGE